MKKDRIIIETRDGIPGWVGLKRVLEVMGLGRISEARSRDGTEILHYCWLTRLNDGVIVVTRRKKSASSPDSFVVYREKPRGEA